MTEKYRVPVEVLLYCKDMNIEKVDNILGEYGITLNGSILVDNDKSINSMETDDDFNVSLSDERVRSTMKYFIVL